jgi:hypothetical protein
MEVTLPFTGHAGLVARAPTGSNVTSKGAAKDETAMTTRLAPPVTAPAAAMSRHAALKALRGVGVANAVRVAEALSSVRCNTGSTCSRHAGDADPPRRLVHP